MDTMTTTLQRAEQELSATTAALKGARAHHEKITHPGNFTTEAGAAGALAEWLPVLTGAEATAARTAQDIAVQAMAIIAQTASAPLSLTPAEYAAANNRAAFVAEDVQGLNLSQLHVRLSQALAVNDRPGLYLFLRALPARLATADPGLETGGAAIMQTLQTLLGEVEERLQDRSLAPVNTRATALLEQAQRLQSDAEARRREAAAMQAISALFPHGAVPIPDDAG